LCGIAGFIGQSKIPEITCEIITQVFSRTEVRGIDAAGFWGVDSDGTVLYHKEPRRSSELVKTDTWKDVIARPLDLFLVHARAASQGVGEPYVNRNNHPFLSTDGNLGLIHNGRITEYEILRQKYQVLSDCDSEILLRIIEAGEDYNESDFPDMEPPLSSRFMGIRDVFSLINHGHMAVALGERLDGRRRLWLFRNRHRSLWAVDLRHSLGQIFFCSTPEIWREALSVCKPFRKQKLVEIPEEEVWFFEVGEKQQVSGVSRYQVCKETICGELAKGAARPITNRPKRAVVTRLNEEDELPVSVKKKDKRTGPYPLTELETCCMHISESLRKVQTLAFAMAKDGTMTDCDWSSIIESMNTIKLDIDGTVRIMEQ